MNKVVKGYGKSEQLKKKVNEKDDDRFTPLHYAVKSEHFAICQLLIQNGAGMYIRYQINFTYSIKFFESRNIPNEVLKFNVSSAFVSGM